MRGNGILVKYIGRAATTSLELSSQIKKVQSESFKARVRTSVQSCLVLSWLNYHLLKKKALGASPHSIDVKYFHRLASKFAARFYCGIIKNELTFVSSSSFIHSFIHSFSRVSTEHKIYA